ncbi:MAG: histidine kinase [Flavobacteriales bacterium]|nr:histidine kinase [Flavobacteriales bacterium]
MVKQLTSESIGNACLAINKRYLPIILAVAFLEFVLLLILHFLFSERPLFELQLVEIVILTDLLMLPLAAVNGIFLSQQFLKKSVFSGWKMIALKILASFISVLLVSYLLESIYASFGFVDDDYIVFNKYRLSPSVSNIIENTFYALVIGTPIFIWQLRVEELDFKLKEKEMEQERLIQLKTKAELHALQSKINPHFLFNSFNSIASLISTNPNGAEAMMIKLSELFRYSLSTQESNFVTVKEELRIVKTYLEIEKIRFGENLDYKICQDPELSSLYIPRFLLQPLVENAVKHAISKIKQGELLLELKSEEESIVIKLYDNGAPFPTPLTIGYGLQSTFDKLELLYPEAHTIELVNFPNKYVFIELKLENLNGA